MADPAARRSMDSDQTTLTLPENRRSLETAAWPACLVVVGGPGTGNKFLLTRSETMIGRADEAEVRLAKAGVSRRHALIRRLDGPQFLLSDLGSTNGTYVNTRRLQQEVLLKDQDLIGIGDSRLKYIAADSPEQPYYQELYQQAQLDKALQVYNKHHFLTRLEEELLRHQHAGLPLSLIMLDVDHFKRINDSHGHLAGDAGLLHLTETIKSVIRDSDVLCRYGGEEFALIMPMTQLPHAVMVAEKIRQTVAVAPLEYAGQRIPMTISLGLSVNAPQGEPQTREALISQADRALYRAKASGRNQAVVYTAGLGDRW